MTIEINAKLINLNNIYHQKITAINHKGSPYLEHSKAYLTTLGSQTNSNLCYNETLRDRCNLVGNEG